MESIVSFSQVSDAKLLLDEIITKIEEEFKFEKELIAFAAELANDPNKHELLTEVFHSFDSVSPAASSSSTTKTDTPPVGVNESLINNIESVSLHSKTTMFENNGFYNDNSSENQIDNKTQIISSHQPLRDLAVNRFHNNNAVDKFRNELSEINREIRYETRSKLKRKNDNDDEEDGQKEQYEFMDHDDEENKENIEFYKSSSQPTKVTKKLKSKKENILSKNRSQQTVPILQTNLDMNNNELTDKENAVAQFLAENAAKLPTQPEFQHNHVHLSDQDHCYAAFSSRKTAEPQQKMLKSEPVFHKPLEPITLNLECDDDNENYNLNQINNALKSVNENDTNLLAIVTNSNSSCRDLQNNYMKPYQYVNQLHAAQHHHKHNNQTDEMQHPLIPPLPQTSKPFIPTPTRSQFQNYNDQYSFYRKTSKRKLNEVDAEEDPSRKTLQFHDEFGFTIQLARDQDNFNNNRSRLDQINNNILNNQLDFCQVEVKTNQEANKLKTNDDEEKENVDAEGFRTKYFYNEQDLLEIAKDKSAKELSMQSFCLKIIRILFTREELMDGIIVNEGDKNRSKNKEPLDYDRINIVKDVMRHKYRIPLQEIETSWNAIRSKLNSRIRSIGKK